MFCVDGLSHCPCFDNCADFCYLGQKMVSLYQDHWQNAKTPLPNLPKPSLANQKEFGGKPVLGAGGQNFPDLVGRRRNPQKTPREHYNPFFAPRDTTILFSGFCCVFCGFYNFLLFQAKKRKILLVFPCKWCRAGAMQVARRPRRLHAGHAGATHAGSTQATQVPRKPRMFHACSTHVPRRPGRCHARRFHAGHAGSTQVPRRPRKSRRFHATSLKFSQKVTNFTFCDLQGCSDTFGFSTIFCRSDRAVQHKPTFFRPNNSNVPVWWNFSGAFWGSTEV